MKKDVEVEVGLERMETYGDVTVRVRKGDVDIRVMFERTGTWKLELAQKDGKKSYRWRRMGTWQRELAKNSGDESVTVSTKDRDVALRVTTIVSPRLVSTFWVGEIAIFPQSRSAELIEYLSIQSQL